MPKPSTELKNPINMSSNQSKEPPTNRGYSELIKNKNNPEKKHIIAQLYLQGRTKSTNNNTTNCVLRQSILKPMQRSKDRGNPMKSMPAKKN